MKISVVIPVYNEQDTVSHLFSRLSESLIEFDYEVIIVNDGSQDNTKQKVFDNERTLKNLKLVNLSRNFGHQNAMITGLAHAVGDYVVLMDGDLQDPPEVLPDLIKTITGGYDIVSAVRVKRKEHFIKKGFYFLFYRIYKHLAYIDIPLDSGDFCIISRRVADILNSLPERCKFLRGLRVWAGFKQTTYTYERNARVFGETKYTIIKLLNLAFSGITSFSFIPLRLISILGLVVSSIGFIFAVYTFFVKLIFTTQIISGYTTIELTLLFLGGLILFSLGIIGEYIIVIFEEVKARPVSIIESVYDSSAKFKSEML